MTDLHRRQDALALLDRLLDLSPPERAAVLDRECQGRPELRALVQELLEADGAAHSLLDADAAAALEQEEGGPAVGDAEGLRVGPYRILGEAGRGGMATVFEAERQVADIRQRVALKLVRRGVDTEEVLRRFAQEARLLATLEHPGIARFYDAGVTDQGRPYLAMEFVDGLPLTEYCDARALGVPERLGLFKSVCDAVQFAHQRLVVHRDIKPSNVLVTERGEVKLLDFGIAKLLEDDSEAEAPRTRTGIRLLTPEYAAPEQLHGGEVTTATDVYALGLILFELLTGVRPRVDAGTGGADDDWALSTASVDAPSAAVRWTSRDEGGRATALARSTTPERLRRTLAGDLDTITLKALEPDPSRRYQSARELREDVERHGEGRPILARQPTVRYRLRKFAHRHRGAVLAGVASVLLLVGFTAVYTTRVAAERDLARMEAAKAQLTTEFLQRLLGEAYPSVALGETFSMSDLLARAVARVDSIDSQPEVQAELLRTLGDVYREQGHLDDALPLLERAVALHRVDGPVRTRSGGRALDALGHLRYERGEYDAALETHQEALAVFEALYEPYDSLVLFALNNIAAAASALGDHEEALRTYRAVLDRHGRLFADTSELVHVSHNNLGDLYQQMDSFELAEAELSAAIRIRRLALPADHPSLALSLNNLGVTLRSLGRLEDAERAHRESLEIFRRVFGPDHHRVGLAAFNLAQVLRASGQLDDAEELFRLTLAIDRRTYGPEHGEVGADLRTLGFLLREKGDCEGAAAVLSDADRVFEGNGQPLTNRRRLTARVQWGACLTELGRFDEAQAVLAPTLAAALDASTEADSVGTRQAAERLAELYRARGLPAAADSVQALLNVPSG